ncbi:HU family DNA-binding protein [Candidatus Bipolaricaulota bacterium]|nr:HU family DNA-binding protein [Candidatus Bipolaricaulota bacterium]
MNKSELVDELYGKNECTKKECRGLVTSMVDTIMETVSEGEEVRLINFGTFKPNSRKATVKRNPQTGKKINIDAKVVPKFKAGKGFREKVATNLKPTGQEGYKNK